MHEPPVPADGNIPKINESSAYGRLYHRRTLHSSVSAGERTKRLIALQDATTRLLLDAKAYLFEKLSTPALPTSACRML